MTDAKRLPKGWPKRPKYISGSFCETEDTLYRKGVYDCTKSFHTAIESGELVWADGVVDRTKLAIFLANIDKQDFGNRQPG